MNVGALIYPGLDQLDFTGPFEVLAQLPEARVITLWKDLEAVRDARGLRLLPDVPLDEAPELDVLVVPGGFGQEALMEDEQVLSFLRHHFGHARLTLSVCTGSLLLGAAGLLRGRRATTHWAAMDALRALGADVVDERVVVDGNLVCAAGVTSGIDGALTAAALIAGEETARRIHLMMQYDPRPPYACGTPHSASPDMLEQVREALRPVTERRLATARRIASRWG
jgi:cyclohexyl-isocyanide hydratase